MIINQGQRKEVSARISDNILSFCLPLSMTSRKQTVLTTFAAGDQFKILLVTVNRNIQAISSSLFPEGFTRNPYGFVAIACSNVVVFELCRKKYKRYIFLIPGYEPGQFH